MIDAQIAEIDQAAQAIVAKNRDLQQLHQIRCSIPGIGQATAVSMLVLMPQLDELDEGQTASPSGLAPFARESGKWKGKQFCQGGCAKLRQALYMPTLVALRFNQDTKIKYQDLI